MRLARAHALSPGIIESFANSEEKRKEQPVLTKSDRLQQIPSL